MDGQYRLNVLAKAALASMLLQVRRNYRYFESWIDVSVAPWSFIDAVAGVGALGFEVDRAQLGALGMDVTWESLETYGGVEWTLVEEDNDEDSDQ